MQFRKHFPPACRIRAIGTHSSRWWGIQPASLTARLIERNGRGFAGETLHNDDSRNRKGPACRQGTIQRSLEMQHIAKDRTSKISCLPRYLRKP
jgi:hypothetical protein